MNLFKYNRNDGTEVYVTLNDDGTFRDIRAEDDAVTMGDVLADLVHKLTQAELVGKSLRSHRAQMQESMDVINEHATRLEHGLL